jgi:hypothetical protein
MNIPEHISESLETIFWVKILKFFDADPDPEIFLTRDPGWKKFGINIPDPQHWFFGSAFCYSQRKQQIRLALALEYIVADLHRFDAGPDSAFHFYAGPDPTFHIDADPGSSVSCDADPDPQHCSH